MAIPLRELIATFGRIGLLSFGGPAAQIALMQDILVREKNWIKEKPFLGALSFCMLLPGPEAMQLATYCGWRLRGFWGGVMAGGLFVLPGAILVGILAYLYSLYGTLQIVQDLFMGVKAFVIALLIMAIWRLGRKTIDTITTLILAIIACVLITVFSVPFPWVLIGAAIWGISARVSNEPKQTNAPTITISKTLKSALLGICLWLAPLAVLLIVNQTFLAQVAGFFARISISSFGGAYAVLAYVTQGAVQEFGWLTTPQMIDALGLAETTPGPLILVTEFVAILAGLETTGLWVGLSAGLLCLWMMFVPSFFFIFIAAPYLEWLLSNRRLANVLRTISVAIIGVITALALWFGAAFLFPNGWDLPDLWAFALTGIAILIYIGFKLPIWICLPMMIAAAYSGSIIL